MATVADMFNSTKSKNATKRLVLTEIVFTNITYGLCDEDIEDDDQFETIEELQNSLPQVVYVSVPQKYRRKLKEAFINDNLDEMSEYVWDWFSEETGWLIEDATISTLDGQFSL
jgi:hypothetical protein